VGPKVETRVGFRPTGPEAFGVDSKFGVFIFHVYLVAYTPKIVILSQVHKCLISGVDHDS
jgi:hypothetical protein